MANRAEVSAEQAIDAIASLPWHGQIVKNVYTGKRPIREDGIEGTQVSLVAVWEGAEKLAGDPTVRCIVLEKSPLRIDLADGIHLSVDQVNGVEGREIIRSEFVFRQGEVPVIEKGKQRLVQTVLDNIAQLSVRS